MFRLTDRTTPKQNPNILYMDHIGFISLWGKFFRSSPDFHPHIQFFGFIADQLLATVLLFEIFISYQCIYTFI